MKHVVLVFILVLNINVTDAAEFTVGNELYQWLVEDEKPEGSRFASGLFKGYIGGIVDVGDEIFFCTGKGVTRGQIVAVVSKFVKNNPEKWNKGASSLVIEALKEAFPCKKKGNDH